MNLQTETLSFRFLTPCFSGTAEGKEASASELRVPAIRGHIRFWHRAAFAADSTNRVWPDEKWTPQSKDDLASRLATLIGRPNQPWGAALADESAGKSWSDLRAAASDTPKGPPHLFGNAIPRKPSPVRFKVVELASGLCLLAVAPSKESIGDAETALKSKPDPHRWDELGTWTSL